jgi:hypothetical protein
MINALAPDPDVALVADAVDQIVHPVEVAQQGGLAAAGGANQGGDMTLGDLQVDAVQHLGRRRRKNRTLDLDEAGIERALRRGGRIAPGQVGGCSSRTRWLIRVQGDGHS